MEHILLYAIVPIIVVMLAGYISGKKGIFNGDNAKAFNKVVLDYALPAALFVSIVDASREMLVRDIKLTIISTVGIMVCFMIVYYIYAYCFKKNTKADGAIMALVCGSPTIGFLGFAVLEPIFGTTPSVALVVAIVGISQRKAQTAPRRTEETERLETCDPRFGTACCMGAYTCRSLGYRRNTLARLGKPFFRPYQGCECLYGCIRRRCHPVGCESQHQLAGSARMYPQTGHDAAVGARARPHLQDGSHEPQDARCGLCPSSSLLRHHHRQRIRHLCCHQHIVTGPECHPFYRVLPTMDMDYRHCIEDVRINPISS